MTKSEIVAIITTKNTFPCTPLPPLPSCPAIVGSCDLSAGNVDDILMRHALSNRMRGIRHMLNFHPDYPHYSEATHDNFLTDQNWIQGFSLLEKYQMSFEIHVLPHQMKRLAFNLIYCISHLSVDNTDCYPHNTSSSLLNTSSTITQ